MGRAPETVLVALLDVKLGAPVSSDLIGIAVQERVLWVIQVVTAWHGNTIHSSGTTATNIAQIDVILEVTTKHIGCKVLARVCGFAFRQVHAVVVVI